MKLVAQDPNAVLFPAGFRIESAEIVPSAGGRQAILVVDFDQAATRRWITPAQAYKDHLALIEGTTEQTAMLRGAGYDIPLLFETAGIETTPETRKHK